MIIVSKSVEQKRQNGQLRAQSITPTSNEHQAGTKLKRTNVANAMLGLSVVLFPNTRQYR